MNKILTISVAAYNVEKYLQNTLDSVLDPDIIDEIEVLVIDDGGNDKSLDIAKEFQKKYPNTVMPVHKENGGYGSVLNTAIKMATGKYFKQLDGDDAFETDNLKYMVQRLKELDVDYVTNAVRVHDESTGNDKINDFFGHVAEGIYNIDAIRAKGMVSMHGSTFRTDVLKKMNHSITEHCFYTDVELVLLALPNISTVFISHKELYQYRIGIEEQSMNIKNMIKHQSDHEIVFWKSINLFKEYNKMGEGRNQIFRDRICKEAKVCYKIALLKDQNKDNFREICKFDDELKQVSNEIRTEIMKDNQGLNFLLMHKVRPVYILAHKLLKMKNTVAR